MNNKMKIFVGIVLTLIIILGIILVGKISKKNTKTEIEILNKAEETIITEEPVVEEKKNIKIFNGNDRPIAFMIDNNVKAQPQSALNKAFLVYEIIVEGGETRLMALFKGVDVSNEDITVGPIRSARHYFIDYALESDAIYAHLGQSPQAQNYIKTFNIADINGQIYDTGKSRTSKSLYWRVSHKSAPHNAYTSIASILEISKKNNYSTTSTKESVLNYVPDEVTFDNNEDAKVANTITIPYSTNHKVQYNYNDSTGRYVRYSKGKKQTDELTGEDVTTKNIIIEFIRNTTLNDGENKGRQDLDNFKTVDGYYITNGKAIKIKCRKTAIGVQTQYVDLDGNEIDVNDGNTWINICPIDSEVVFE
jgi:hypothetical protein